jgi:hypothetical protein
VPLIAKQNIMNEEYLNEDIDEDRINREIDQFVYEQQELRAENHD